MRRKAERQDIPSIRSQCPVMTQMHTMDTERQKAMISAPVNLPHMPNEILGVESSIRYSLDGKLTILW